MGKQVFSAGNVILGSQFSVPFLNQTSLEDVVATFKSLEQKGFGKCITEDSRTFFCIDPVKLRASYTDLGVSFSEVNTALQTPSKIAAKYAHLETTYQGFFWLRHLISILNF